MWQLVVYAMGANHDQIGPITSFAAETPKGQTWLDNWGGNIIEDEQVDCVVGCMEADGLTVKRIA